MRRLVRKKDAARRGLLEATLFFTDQLYNYAAAALFFVGLILLFSATVEPSHVFEPQLPPREVHKLESPADPFHTPKWIAPEWYFYAVFRLLKIVPPYLAMGMMGGFFFLLTVIPFIDRSTERRLYKRWPYALATFAIIVVWTWLTIQIMQGL